jgi:hypothetical protein
MFSLKIRDAAQKPTAAVFPRAGKRAAGRDEKAVKGGWAAYFTKRASRRM